MLSPTPQASFLEGVCQCQKDTAWRITLEPWESRWAWKESPILSSKPWVGTQPPHTAATVRLAGGGGGEGTDEPEHSFDSVLSTSSPSCPSHASCFFSPCPGANHQHLPLGQLLPPQPHRPPFYVSSPSHHFCPRAFAPSAPSAWSPVPLSVVTPYPVLTFMSPSPQRSVSLLLICFISFLFYFELMPSFP